MAHLTCSQVAAALYKWHDAPSGGKLDHYFALFNNLKENKGRTVLILHNVIFGEMNLYCETKKK